MQVQRKGLCFYLLGTCWNGSNKGKMMRRKVERCLCSRVCDKPVLFDGYLMGVFDGTVKYSFCAAIFPFPSRPSSGLQPATRRWRAFVRRPSGRPASTRHNSATAPQGVTVAAWHPGPAAPFRGKASIPPGVISARRSSMPEERPNANVSAYKSASTGPCRSGSRLGYRHPTVIAKRSRHRAARRHGSGRAAAHQLLPYSPPTRQR